MRALLPILLPAFALAASASLHAQAGVERPAAPPQSEVDSERERAAQVAIQAYVDATRITPPKDREAALDYFRGFRDGLLALEMEWHGTWAGWQALMTAGQILGGALEQPEEALALYRRVWEGVRDRTDVPVEGVVLNPPRAGLRLAEALIAADRLDEAESVLRACADTESPEGQRLRQRLADLPELRRLAPGRPAPAFDLTDRAGQRHTLDGARGKLFLLHCWSGINGPSLATLPEIAALRAEFEGQPLELLSINLDEHVTREDQERMKQAGQRFLPRLFAEKDLDQLVERFAIDWPLVWELEGMHSKLAKLYAVTNLPAVYLIGADGVILARNLRGDALRLAVARALAALAKD